MNLKKVFTTFFICCVVFGSVAQNKRQPSIPGDIEIEKKIEALISKMSIEEKIGQMIQLEVNMVTYTDPEYSTEALLSKSEKELAEIIRKFDLGFYYDSKSMTDANGRPLPEAGYQFYTLSRAINNELGFKLDNDKLDLVFNTYHVGSILNMLGGSYASDVRTWHDAIRQIQESSLKHLNIPCVYGLDQVHGTNYSKGGTLFPQHIGMVATFNRDLAKRMGEICAYETRACGVPWIFGPTLDIGRKASWPRQYEGVGEDPYLAAEMGVSYLSGLQGDDPNHIGKYHVGTCLKHYFGYGAPDNGIDRTPANITEQDLREKHYAPFLRAFRSGALSAMTNSSILNGMNGVANKRYLTNWLKEDLNWDGMIVTDWGDIENIRVRDHIAPTKKEAIKLAVNAGVDMMMVPSEYGYGSLLKELVDDGSVSMDRINDAVRRILRLKFRIGLFEMPYTDVEDYPLFGSNEHAAVAKQMAIESEVLLKNENQTLPLKRGKKILICGPNANTMRGLNGGWSYSWQGNNVETFTTSYNTILKAMQNKFGVENIIYEPGVTYAEKEEWYVENTPEIEKVIEKAGAADYIMVCIGENSYAETTGNINDLNLSHNQKSLVKAVQTVGKPVILILNQGRPRLISDLVPDAQAVVNIMLPGNYGGDALADLVAGDENFSGRLPFTYPSHPNSFTTYDFKVCENRETMPGIYNYEAHTNVQWWFGEGLSYTKFDYSNFRVNKTKFTAKDELVFTVDVKNTGECKGKEVVMLFSSDFYASLIPDNRRLRAFDKIELEPGESKTVSLKIRGTDLAFVGAGGKWLLEKGDFNMMIGGKFLNITCVEDYCCTTPNIE